MKNYTEHLTDEQVEDLVDAIEETAYASKRDGCQVALVRCTECGKSYEEEVKAAKELVTDRLGFLCLSCDPDASAPSFVGVTVQIGWFS